jgi:hypothetical protein
MSMMVVMNDDDVSDSDNISVCDCSMSVLVMMSLLVKLSSCQCCMAITRDLAAILVRVIMLPQAAKCKGVSG